MAHSLLWPGKYLFYAVGNTPATCLTRDLSPDEPANVLLLGCGDPRHILYTIFSEPASQTRKLDFTCCDLDPGVLARNVLLFTMILDGASTTDTIWNIFFHIYLDKDSQSALVEQCTKLISYSKSSKQWNDSSYGSFLRMCTDYTLEELRRHWTLYAEMQNIPRSRLDSLRKSFTALCKSSEKMPIISVSARSAGPSALVPGCISTATDQFVNYWKSGTTFTDTKDIVASTFLNPTFVYSLAGEGCHLHYATDPMIPFHHAAVFGNAKTPPTIADMVKSAKASFNDWCSSFKSHSSSCVVRFFLGDAIAVCAALGAYAETGSLDTGIPIMRWKMPLIRLNKEEYISGSAPRSFNLIDTSNLEDHIGLLNIITATAPLLSRSNPSSILYTEGLVLGAQEETTKHFYNRLCTNIAVASLLFGLCPVDYLSSFSSRCSTNEILYSSLNQTCQFHRVTAWKLATSGDVLLAPNAANLPAPMFDTTQLAALLYNMYRAMFEREDPEIGLKEIGIGIGNNSNNNNNNNNFTQVAKAYVIFYPRESFALMLKNIRKNLQISSQQWLEVMDKFVALHDDDTSMLMEAAHYNDLCVHLYRHSIYTHDFYRLPLNESGIFLTWPSVPLLVRIFLTVPRSALTILERMAPENIGTPPLQCNVEGKMSNNIFSSVHAAFGRVVLSSTDDKPSVVFEEDEKGWKGESSLIVSFVMSSILLTGLETQKDLVVGFGIKTCLCSAHLVGKLGEELVIYSAKLIDRRYVIVVPEMPLPQPAVSSSISVLDTNLSAEIGPSNPVVVQLDKQCKLLSSFTCRIPIENDEIKRAFEAGESPTLVQMSPCVMKLTLSGYKQDIIYPFPVVGSENTLRLARKSLWIEVVVPISGPFKPDGMKLAPFPVVRLGDHFIPWNIHRINLSRLPSLDIKSKHIDSGWYNTHITSMMSMRERQLREKQQDGIQSDPLMCIKDSLHVIFLTAVGIQVDTPRRLFTLRDKATSNSDTILFISDVKYDLHSHTMVCDGYALCFTHEIMPKIKSRLHLLVAETAKMVQVNVSESEMRAWKQLLPAFAERCRSSWSHRQNCEYKTQNKIPLTTEMELSPLCSCGLGKDTEEMKKVALWREYAPYVTRVAISPLFAVPYMETIWDVNDEMVNHKNKKDTCSVCRGVGKPKLLMCSACKKIQYCGRECQKKDWKTHKAQCKP